MASRMRAEEESGSGEDRWCNERGLEVEKIGGATNVADILSECQGVGQLRALYSPHEIRGEPDDSDEAS